MTHQNGKPGEGKPKTRAFERFEEEGHREHSRTSTAPEDGNKENRLSRNSGKALPERDALGRAGEPKAGEPADWNPNGRTPSPR